MQITDVTAPEISALTRILQLLPSETPTTHGQRITSATSSLPSRLKRATRLSSLILPSQSQSHSHTLCTTTGTLCKQHKPLSSPLIHSIFTLLALETGSRLNTLTLHSTALTPTERSRIQELRELHSLWLPPAVYRQTFLSPPNSTQWPYNSPQCAACMLSRIAGHMPTLLSLRMVLLSRTSSRESRNNSKPRLTPYIEAWIASLSTALKISSEAFETLISTNDTDALALKETRKQLWRKRRESRRVFRAAQQEQKERRSRRATQAADGDILSPAPAPPADGERPTIRVSAASTPEASIEGDGSDSNPSDAENDLIDAYAALTSTPYLSSIASTVSLHERPRTYIFPQTLTTHENAGIGAKRTKRQILPVRPLPTNFNAVVSSVSGKSQAKNQLEVSNEQEQQPPILNALPSPSLYSPTCPSANPHSPTGRDSYLPPTFPHHEAYIPPSAADRAKRYQNLLSPNPLLRESEEELRIGLSPRVDGGKRESEEKLRTPETPGLPRRSSRRISPPVGVSEQDEPQFGVQETETKWHPGPSPVSSISSLARSHTSREHPSSWISSISSMSTNSAYSSSLKPAPLSLRSSKSSSSKDRVVSTFTIKEGEVDADWYAQKSNVGVGRAKTTREVSSSNLQSSTRRSHDGRNSVATDATRWSDVYKCFSEDVKR